MLVPVAFEDAYDGIHVVPHLDVEVYKLRVAVCDHGVLRLEGKEQRPASEERLDVFPVVLRNMGKKRIEHLGLAAGPFQDGLRPFAFRFARRLVRSHCFLARTAGPLGVQHAFEGAGEERLPAVIGAQGSAAHECCDRST